MKIVIQMNKTVIDYLDVTMNLTDGSFKPFIKPNSHISYVHSQSDHWNTVLKHIPLHIENRLNSLSSTEPNFASVKDAYQNALKQAGYNHVLRWHEKDVHQSINQTKRKRKKTICYFNPPFSRIIKTNLGKEYIRLVKKWFMSNPSMKSEFNTSTMKVSYSACSKMKDFINGHNKMILKDTHDNDTQNLACN